MKLEKHWGISLLAILAIGPGLMLNTALNAIRPLLQAAYHGDNLFAITPVLIGVISFAFFIPFGPISRHVLGERRTYVVSSCLFLVGAIISSFANHFFIMDIGRLLQGMGTGLALMMMIPMLVLSFPIAKRNLALIMLIGGFYGSSVIGLFLGVIINSYGHWRMLFYLAIALSLIGLCVSFKILTNEHAQQQRKHQPPLDVVGTVLMFVFLVFIVFTLLMLQKFGWNSVYVWIGAIGSFIFLSYLFIAEYFIENPLINVRLIKLPKPTLAILIAILGNVSMGLSMLSMQGMLKNTTHYHTVETLFIYLGLIIGVVIVTVLTTILYDKLGPGILGMFGGVIIIVVNLLWTFTANNVPTYLYVSSFVAIIIGIGFTVAAGLMGAALGGPLPTLIPRMVAVQFIRIAMYAVVPVCISVTFKQMNDLHKVSSGLQTYHTFSLLSCVVSVLILCLSFFMFLTGKGHKLSHKPHDNPPKKENEELMKKNQSAAANREPIESVPTHSLMKDSEYRNTLRKFNKQKERDDHKSNIDHVFRKGLKKVSHSTKE